MPIELFPAIQYVHYLGLLIFVAGVLTTAVSGDDSLRQRAAYFVAAPGFLMAWGGGHLLMEFVERELFSVVNVVGFLILIVLMNITHLRAARSGKKGSARSTDSTGWLSLRRFGYVEALSLVVLLFVAMPLKYLGDIDIAVRVVGMVHGILFLVFVGWVAVVARRGHWTVEKIAGALAASVIPFGPFVADLGK